MKYEHLQLQFSIFTHILPKICSFQLDLEENELIYTKILSHAVELIYQELQAVGLLTPF